MTTPTWRIPPNDPDEPAGEGWNEDRAVRALAAIDSFSQASQLDDEDTSTVLHDMICNLAHWCDRNMEELGESLAVIINRAAESYHTETDGEGRQFAQLIQTPLQWLPSGSDQTRPEELEEL